MQIILSNNIRLRGANTPLRAAITKALTIDNPAVIERLRKKQPAWGLERYLRLYIADGNDLIMPRGFLEDLLDTLKEHRYSDIHRMISDQQTTLTPIDFGEWNPKFPLRDDQALALRALTKNGVLIAPAGSGKTVMGMRYIWETHQPTIWLTHTKDLLDQTVKKAYTLLGGVEKIGTIIEGRADWGSGKLIVAMVQSLGANPQLIEILNPLIGCVVVDECHHFPAPAFIDVAGKFSAKFMLGLTATPNRKDKLEVYMYRGIGQEVYRIYRKELYGTGHLVRPAVKFVYTDFVYEEASDYNNELGNVDAGGEEMNYHKLIQKLMADEARAKLIVERIIESCPPNNHQIVICESVRYCYILAELLKRIARARWGTVPRIAVVHGPISRYVWRVAKSEFAAADAMQKGECISYRRNRRSNRWEIKVAQYTEAEFERWKLTDTERKDIIEKARRKEIDVLFATQLAREGLDLPHLAIGHMAMPKRGDKGDEDGAALEQEIGRIMRPDPDNPTKKALWYDYVDYNVGVLRSQYYSRRSVYKRLGIVLPKKPRTEAEKIDEFLTGLF